MLFAAAAYTFTACNSAEEPVIAQPDGQTTPMTRAATIENFARHLIVEVNDVNILNAGEYYLSNGEPFFTHVVIYSSNIRGDANGNVYAYNNPNNAAILADPDKYIKPLQAKGIKVLLGYLGDHTGAGSQTSRINKQNRSATRLSRSGRPPVWTAISSTMNGRNTEPAAGHRQIQPHSAMLF